MADAKTERPEVTVIEMTSVMEDDDSPQWPDAEAETAFLSEQRIGGELSVPPAAPGSRNGKTETGSAEVPDLPLPPLQSLVDRIPADARDVLEELFRARFVSVKRVQSASFK